MNRKYKDFNQYNANYQVDKDVLDIMKQEAEKQKISLEGEEYEKSLPLITTQLKALIARDLWDMSEYYQVMNTTNESVIKALWVLNESYEKFLPIASISE
jgi:carboxyl-terminal processing protease